MRILICDDDQSAHFSLEIFIKNYFGEKIKNVRIQYVKTSSEMFEILENFDILFLDVKLGNECGIDIAQKMRENNIQIPIIYISAYIEGAIKGYETKASSYLLKPFDMKCFSSAMDIAINDFKKNHEISPIFESWFCSICTPIKVKELAMIERIQRKIFLHHESGQLQQTSQPWKYITKKLLKYNCFFSPQTSYIINIAYIKDFSRKRVKLKNEFEINFNKNGYEIFCTKFSNYVNYDL